MTSAVAGADSGAATFAFGLVVEATCRRGLRSVGRFSAGFVAGAGATGLVMVGSATAGGEGGDLPHSRMPIVATTVDTTTTASSVYAASFDDMGRDTTCRAGSVARAT